MKQWVCSKCSSRNRENMKFCPVCHIPRSAVPLPPQHRVQKEQAAFSGTVVQRFSEPVRALKRARSILIMKLLVLLNIAVMFASLVGLMIMKGR